MQRSEVLRRASQLHRYSCVGSPRTCVYTHPSCYFVCSIAFVARCVQGLCRKSDVCCMTVLCELFVFLTFVLSVTHGCVYLLVCAQGKQKQKKRTATFFEFCNADKGRSSRLVLASTHKTEYTHVGTDESKKKMDCSFFFFSSSSSPDFISCSCTFFFQNFPHLLLTAAIPVRCLCPSGAAGLGCL